VSAAQIRYSCPYAKTFVEQLEAVTQSISAKRYVWIVKRNEQESRMYSREARMIVEVRPHRLHSCWVKLSHYSYINSARQDRDERNKFRNPLDVGDCLELCLISLCWNPTSGGIVINCVAGRIVMSVFAREIRGLGSAITPFLCLGAYLDGTLTVSLAPSLAKLPPNCTDSTVDARLAVLVRGP
jgi:hypothetical protein